MTGVGIAGVQLGVTVFARPLDLTVTFVVIGQINAGTMSTRVSSTVVNVDLTIHTCIIQNQNHSLFTIKPI